MEPDRQKARTSSRLMLYLALALLVVLAIALVGSCRESDVAPERIAPDGPEQLGAATSSLTLGARPLLRAA